MILILFICSIILLLIFFIYNKYILGSSTESNIIMSIFYFILSLLLAYGVNLKWNPDPILDILKAPKNKKPTAADASAHLTTLINNMRAEQAKVAAEAQNIATYNITAKVDTDATDIKNYIVEQ